MKEAAKNTLGGRMLFSEENCEFLNQFYKTIEDLSINSYDYATRCLTSNNIQEHFDSSAVCALLLVNKGTYQNLLSFFSLIEQEIFISACVCLRAYIEDCRLFRAIFLNKEYMNAYLQNRNIDFARVRDEDFMQSRVIKRLEAQLKEAQEDGSFVGDVRLANKALIKGSIVSGLHSELSKWSHLNNINLLTCSHITDNTKIALSIKTEMSNANIQQFVQKYISEIFWLLTSHLELLRPFDVNGYFEVLPDSIFYSMVKYLDLFYDIHI